MSRRASPWWRSYEAECREHDRKTRGAPTIISESLTRYDYPDGSQLFVHQAPGLKPLVIV